VRPFSGYFREEPERGNVPGADKEKSRIGSSASSDSGARIAVMLVLVSGLPESFTSKIFTIFEGTSEIQRMLIGRTVTELDVR
jgi:alkylation response protein AidB-like acyl-CoA dehydrogenase